MKLQIKNTENFLNISDEVFNQNFNRPLIHQVIVSLRSSLRQGTKSQKNRSDVSGSGKKPWKQKGTGRARAGSRGSPIWRSGGVTFASKKRSFKKKINKKMYKKAIKSIFSELIREKRLIIVEDICINKPKTQLFLKKIKVLSDEKKILIILSKVERNMILSSRNLRDVRVCSVNCINPIYLISFKRIVLTVDAIKKIEKMFL